jgi:hypothetical protein
VTCCSRILYGDWLAGFEVCLDCSKIMDNLVLEIRYETANDNMHKHSSHAYL